MHEGTIALAVRPELAQVTEVPADVVLDTSTELLAMAPVEATPARLKVIELGEVSVAYGDAIASVEPVSARASCGHIPSWKRTLRNLALIGTAGVAGTSVAACSGGRTSIPLVAATASPNISSYNPSHCVTVKGGQTYVDLACAEKGFPAQLPAAIQHLEESVVTIQVVTGPVDDKGDIDAGYLTGSAVSEKGILSAGHANEDVTPYGCSKQWTVAAIPKLSGKGGTIVPVGGFYDSWHKEDKATSNDPDVSIAQVSGNALSNLPEMPVVNNVVLPPGVLAVAFSEQPTEGEDEPHMSTDEYPSDTQIDEVEFVSAGPDKKDPKDTDLIPVGTYTNGAQPAPEGGASGSPLIPLDGPDVGKDIGILVRTSVDDANAPAPDFDEQGVEQATKDKVVLTENGKQMPEGDGTPLTQVNAIPSDASGNFQACTQP